MKIIIFTLFILVSCAGYKFEEKNNPFTSYNINSITIPMFVNDSIVPNVSGQITHEIITLLNSYTGLRVYSGEKNADAILIGIIESDSKMKELITATSKQYITGALKDSVGPREAFYVPKNTSYKLSLRVVIVKDPTIFDKKIVYSEITNLIKHSPKTVLDVKLPLSASFSRALNSRSNDEAQVNFTKNKALFEKNIKNIAISARNQFKQVVLNAF